MTIEAITVIALQLIVIVALMVECMILARQKRLSDEAMEPPSVRKRKGHMRNQPCPCGSDQKFKRCCWGKYE